MLNRILAIVRAHLEGEWFGESGSKLPLGPLLINGFLSATLCFLAAGELGPYGYAIFALSIPLALTTIPLLGELGPLLRSDPAADWIGALPVRAAEIRAARIIVMATLLGVLALACLIPAALLAPAAMDYPDRVLLVSAGLAQTAAIAACLLWLQALCGERIESLLVLVQVLLFCGVIMGTVVGLQYLPTLALIEAPSRNLLLYPPACFGSFLLAEPFATPAPWIAILATLGAALTMVLAPFPPQPRARRTRSPLSILLHPLRLFAQRVWVRKEERAIFDLVYDALPSERDFVMRAYPLVAVPLAFMLLGAEPGDVRAQGYISLLLFTPAIYLPVLLVHLPATATPAARWLVETSELDPAVEREGALKAVAMRFLAPLYIALIAVAWAQSDLDLTLRLACPAAAAGLITLRLSYHPKLVSSPPLSQNVHELTSAFEGSLSSTLLGMAMVHPVLAILTFKLVDSALLGLTIGGLAVVVELVNARRSADRRVAEASTGASQ